MKLTSNYIVYINEENKVRCAKCRTTGRFVTRVTAQLEYENEYNYFSSSVLTFFIVFIIMYLSNIIEQLENVMTTLAMNLDQVLTHFNNGHTIVLFTHLNTYLFNSKVNSVKELSNLLNTGEIVKGRVL